MEALDPLLAPRTGATKADCRLGATTAHSVVRRDSDTGMSESVDSPTRQRSFLVVSSAIRISVIE